MRISPFTSLACLAALAASLPGCFAKTLDVGSNDAGPVTPSPGPTPTSGDAGPASPGDPVDHGPPYTASTIQGIAALCDAPHGPIDAAPTVGDVRTKIAGAWYLCSSSEPSVDTVRSMELTTGNAWYNLIDDGHGGLVRAQGIDSQGTYQVTDSQDQPDAAPDAPTTGFVQRFRGPGMFPDFVQFERGPRRMQISEGTSAFIEWFVYIGPSTAP